MSQQITTQFVDQYKSNIMILSQQRGSRLRDCVRNETQKGDRGFYDQVDAVAAVKVTSRHSDTPQIDTPHARRAVDLQNYVWSDLIDDWDKVMVLKSPESEYAQLAGFAFGRAMDEEIIRAATGTALTGHTGATSVALPASQQVAITVGATGGLTNVGLNVDKLIAAKKILDKNEVDAMQPRYIAVRAEQIEDLLNETEVTSADFNTVKALVKGEVDTYMGFNFKRLELLNNGSDANSTTTCFAWSKMGINLAVGMDVKVRIDERNDKNYATQVWANMSIGATRMEEKQVVDIACAEIPS